MTGWAVVDAHLPAGRSRGIVLGMKPAISSDSEIMGATPCLTGTRMPFQTLLDYLEGGDHLTNF